MASVALLGAGGTEILMDVQKMCCRLGVQRLFATKPYTNDGRQNNECLPLKKISSSCGSSSFSSSLLSLSKCFPSSSDPLVSMSWLDVFDISDSWFGVVLLCTSSLGLSSVWYTSALVALAREDIVRISSKNLGFHSAFFAWWC